MNWVFVHMPGDMAGEAEIPLGALGATAALARELRKRGHRTSLVAQCSTPLKEFVGMDLVRVEKDEEWSWKEGVRSRGKVDMLVGLSRVDLMRWCLGDRQICWQHNPSIPHGISWEGRKLYWLTQAMICPSQSASESQRRWGAPRWLLRVIPNGLDQGIFHPSLVLGEGERRWRLAFVGSCSYWKGLDWALDLFRYLRSRFPQVQLAIYGDSPVWPEDRPRPEWLRLGRDGKPDWAALEAEMPGLRYHGKVPAAELARALQTTGFLICASRHEETFSLAVLEAQACGCLPVALPRGAYRERIDSGVTGFLATGLQREAWNDLWMRVLRMEGEALAQMRRSAAGMAERYSWGAVGEAFEGLADQLKPLGWGHRLGYRLHARLRWQFPPVSTGYGN